MRVERVRIGIVGIGNIAPLNVMGYLEHDRCDVVALCDPRLDKARAMADQWGVPKVYRSLDELLADDEIDAVEILTPTHMHKDHALAAIAAGKHVSCQKPIANTVADGIEMTEAAARAGVVFRVSECYFGYPPLRKAKQLIADGAIGEPTMLRMKTLVANTDTKFQAELEHGGYVWRFNDQSPGGHLFDDVVHKYATALWMFDEKVRSVQSYVRQGALFFETPTAAIWEYERENLLAMMEVTHAPNMHMRSSYYGADEFFEIQGSDGWIWVTRCTGEMHDLAPVILYNADGTTTTFPNVNADWGEGFRNASRDFVDALLEGRPDPEMSGALATETLQLCFAVYQAAMERRAVEPSSISGSVTPPWWPPTIEHIMRTAGLAAPGEEPSGTPPAAPRS